MPWSLRVIPARFESDQHCFRPFEAGDVCFWSADDSWIQWSNARRNQQMKMSSRFYSRCKTRSAKLSLQWLMYISVRTSRLPSLRPSMTSFWKPQTVLQCNVGVQGHKEDLWGSANGAVVCICGWVSIWQCFGRHSIGSWCINLYAFQTWNDPYVHIWLSNGFLAMDCFDTLDTFDK